MSIESDTSDRCFPRYDPPPGSEGGRDCALCSSALLSSLRLSPRLLAWTHRADALQLDTLIGVNVGEDGTHSKIARGDYTQKHRTMLNVACEKLRLHVRPQMCLQHTARWRTVLDQSVSRRTCHHRGRRPQTESKKLRTHAPEKRKLRASVRDSCLLTQETGGTSPDSHPRFSSPPSGRCLASSPARLSARSSA